MEPNFVDFLKFFGVYFAIGFAVHLLLRVSEVVDYFRECDRLNKHYLVSNIKYRWNLEREYDLPMLGYVGFLVLWPLGLTAYPFMYSQAIWYVITLPFKTVGVRLVPNWLTMTSIVDRLNTKRKERGEIR